MVIKIFYKIYYIGLEMILMICFPQCQDKDPDSDQAVVSIHLEALILQEDLEEVEIHLVEEEGFTLD